MDRPSSHKAPKQHLQDRNPRKADGLEDQELSTLQELSQANTSGGTAELTVQNRVQCSSRVPKFLSEMIWRTKIY